MESDAEIRCRKRPTLSKFPSTRSNTRLSTRYALDVLHGVGLDAGSTVAAKRVLMRPEAAFPYVFAAEGAQHPPKKPPRNQPKPPQNPPGHSSYTMRGGQTVTPY